MAELADHITYLEDRLRDAEQQVSQYRTAIGALRAIVESQNGQQPPHPQMVVTTGARMRRMRGTSERALLNSLRNPNGGEKPWKTLTELATEIGISVNSTRKLIYKLRAEGKVENRVQGGPLPAAWSLTNVALPRAQEGVMP